MLKPHFLDIHHQFYLNIITSLAVADTMSGYLSGDLQIKWPNDILYENNKLGGILIKNYIHGSMIDFSIVGIGLNVNQLSFKTPNAVSISMITGRKYQREMILKYLLEVFENRYDHLKAGKMSKLKEEYLEYMMGLGEKRRFNDGKNFEGIIRGIDQTGKLLIECDKSEVRAYAFKEVSYVFD